ncbi:MAG: glycosyltransferase [Pseudomonadota bacterium]
MRIHFVGNVCNNHYVFAKGLRSMGVDAHLFLTPFDLPCAQHRPESEDSELSKGYPDWIHTMSQSIPRPIVSIPRKYLSEILACDLVDTHGNHAYHIRNKVPYVIHPYGADFYDLPFIIPEYSRLDIRFPFIFFQHHFFTKRRFRQNYSDASAIIMGHYDRLWKQGYEKLLLSKKIAPIPLSIDTDKFSFCANRGDVFRKKYPKFKFFIFQTARQVWTPKTVKRLGSKRNDILFKGFSIFAQAHKDALLVLVDKGDPDIDKSKTLIRELGIQDSVIWIESMKRYELIKYLHSCDLFIDSFATGGHGCTALEAMSCGAPVMMYLNSKRYNQILGETPPLINVKTPEALAEKMAYYYKHQDKLRDVAIKQRDFVERRHSLNAVCGELIKLYEDIIKGQNKYHYIDQQAFL